MAEGVAGEQAAARGALDEALLDQERLDDLLDGVARLGERCRDGLDPDRAAAEKILARIDKKFEQLTWFPFIGRERSSFAPGLRSVIVGTHLIFYTVEDDSIVVVRVIDGRMDIDEEFRK